MTLLDIEKIEFWTKPVKFNTHEDVLESDLYIDVYLKPQEPAEYIKMNVIVMPTGTEFYESI